MTTEEKEEMLYRAFVKFHADYIVIRDRREGRKTQAASYGLNQGWLKGELHEIDEHFSYATYRLTPEGRQHFRLAVKP